MVGWIGKCRLSYKEGVYFLKFVLSDHVKI